MAAETETVPESLPDSVDVAGAVAMLDGAGQAEEADREPEPLPDAEQGEPADEPEADVEVEADPQAAVADEAPEFWSAEDKAAWQDVHVDSGSAKGSPASR